MPTYDPDKIYRKVFTGQVKGFPNGFPSEAQNNERGEIIVYASTFGNYDRQGEAVAPGAFSKNGRLEKFLNDGFIAVNHDWSVLPIGYPMWAREDEKGLLVGGRLHSTHAAQDARTTMKERYEDGKTVKFSIGYRVISYEETPEGILLTELELWEFSYVNIPANPLADIVAIKGDNNGYDSKTDNDGQRRQPGPDIFHSAEYGNQAKYWRRETGGLGYDLEEDGAIKSITGALVGQTYANHADTVLIAVEGLLDRTKSISDIRKKEGRVLSSNTRQRLNELLDYLENVRQSVEELIKIGEKPQDTLTQEEVTQVENAAEEVLATNPQTEEEVTAKAPTAEAQSEVVNVQETQVVNPEQETEAPETSETQVKLETDYNPEAVTNDPANNATGEIVMSDVNPAPPHISPVSEALKAKAEFLRLSTKFAGR